MMSGRSVSCSGGTAVGPLCWAHAMGAWHRSSAPTSAIEGLKERAISARRLLPPVQAIDDREEESSRPPAHQDAGERFDGAVEPPLLREDHVAVAGGRVGDRAEVEGRLE